jgi:HEPN superfamily AbiU2-like protein
VLACTFGNPRSRPDDKVQTKNEVAINLLYLGDGAYGLLSLVGFSSAIGGYMQCLTCANAHISEARCGAPGDELIEFAKLGLGEVDRSSYEGALIMGNRMKLGNLKPTSELTEEDWVGELKHIDDQLTRVLDVFNFLEELIRLSNESDVALSAFNTTPLFWNVFRDSLQESMFMGVGRLCDISSDVVNVGRVLAGAMGHAEFFSKEALRRRLAKRDLTDSLADHLIENAWVPENGSALRPLKTEISSHLRRIEEIYLPVRGSYYGHRSIGVDARALFEKTSRTELGETLDILRQLVGGLQFLYDNGVKPRVDVSGTKAIDLTSRRYVRDVVKAVAGREL